MEVPGGDGSIYYASRKGFIELNPMIGVNVEQALYFHMELECHSESADLRPLVVGGIITTPITTLTMYN